MRWITTVNGYLRSVIFGAGQITANQKANLTEVASYIWSVYVTSFLEIHLKSAAAESPITLF